MRVIGRLDVKNEFVIKGIHLEGLRKVGDPNVLAKKYYEQGIDEIFFIDSVASLYDRNNLFHIIREASKEVFIPITIGGGIRSLHDVEMALESGADKVMVNTGAVKNPTIIGEIAARFGSQCIVASIEAKKVGDDWECYVDNGREKTGLKVLEWARRLEGLGAGELILTSIDYEGTKKGFDVNLNSAVNEALQIPVVFSGGCGELKHLDPFRNLKAPSGVAIASVLHYNLIGMPEFKKHLKQLGFEVRIES